MLSQESWTFALSSRTLEECYSRRRPFKTSHVGSIEFRSGDWASHFSTITLFFLKNPSLSLKYVWDRCPAWTETSDPSSTSGCFASNSWTKCHNKLRLSSMNSSCPTPLHAIDPHTIIDPPPCLTIGTRLRKELHFSFSTLSWRHPIQKGIFWTRRSIKLSSRTIWAFLSAFSQMQSFALVSLWDQGFRPTHSSSRSLFLYTGLERTAANILPNRFLTSTWSFGALMKGSTFTSRRISRLSLQVRAGERPLLCPSSILSVYLKRFMISSSSFWSMKLCGKWRLKFWSVFLIFTISNDKVPNLNNYSPVGAGHPAFP